MKKKILLLIGLFAFGLLKAQIGVNTENPLVLFHVDGGGDNGSNPTILELLNDVVITDDGDVGIGTINPLNKFHIVSTTTGLGLNTGLRLTNGLEAGAALTSLNNNGDASWKSSNLQYQTIVHAQVSTVQADTAIIGVPDGIGNSDQDALKLIFYRNVVVDGVRSIFGDNYGWSVVDQEFVVPADGVFRLTCVTYLKPVQRTVNPRVYPYLNGNRFYEFGFMSTSQQNGGQDQSILYSGLARLRRGDILDFRTCVYYDQGTPVPNGQVSTSSNFGHLIFHANQGHTYFIIESL